MKRNDVYKFCQMMALFTLLTTNLLFADKEHVTIREDQTCHTDLGDLAKAASIREYIDADNAAIASPQDARQILDAISGTPAIHASDTALGCSGKPPAPVKPNYDATDFYTLIHVLRWKDPSSTDTTKPQVVDKQNWYVYHGGTTWRFEDFHDRSRMFGSKNVWLLFVHLNARTKYVYEARYDIDIADITPAPLADALALAQLFASGTGQSAAEKPDFIGMYRIGVVHTPDEISVQPEAVAAPASGGSPAITKLSDAPVKFVNEGRYHFDFGVAVPIRKISQTTIDTSAGTITPTSAATTNAFGVIDIYPYPNDVRNAMFSYIPYLVSGAAIGSQPLHKILLAAGWGPKFAQFYFGAVLVKQQSVTGSTTHSSYEPQFSFGINLSVKALNDLTKKK